MNKFSFRFNKFRFESALKNLSFLITLYTIDNINLCRFWANDILCNFKKLPAKLIRINIILPNNYGNNTGDITTEVTRDHYYIHTQTESLITAPLLNPRIAPSHCELLSLPHVFNHKSHCKSTFMKYSKYNWL